MRDDLYVDSYRRYKSGTSQFAKWLVQAARLCGEKVQFGGSKSDRHLIPLHQFAPLARAVADATESKIDTTSLTQALSTLKDVINLRKEASVFFRQHSSSKELFDSNNDGHLFVITVLEEVQGILEALRPAVPERIEDEVSAADSTKPNVNLYDALDVEGIAEPTYSQDLVVTNESKQTKAKAKANAREHKDEVFELGTSEEDLYFILFTFFRDLNEVRTFLRETWESYRDGSTPLMSASVTTDLAIEVVRQKERSFLDTEVLLNTGEQTTLQAAFTKAHKGMTTSTADMYWRSADNAPKHGTYLGDLLLGFVSTLGNSPRAVEREADHVTLRMYEIADWLCIPSHVILQICAREFRGEETKGVPIHFLDSRNRKGATAGNEARKLFEDDFEVLCNMMLELAQLKAADVMPNAVDAWTRGVCDILKVGEASEQRRRTSKAAAAPTIPVWLAWASSVVLDISHTLGENDGRGYQELRETGKITTTILNDHFKWSKNMFDPAWTKQHDQILRQVCNFVEKYVEADLVGELGRLTMGKGNESNPPHYLMKRHPLWCGIMTFELNLNLWGAGIELTNIWASFFSASHLYNMAIHEAKPDQAFEWPDIDYLIALHGEEHLFFGGRPKRPTEYSNRLLLAMGMSAEHLAGDSRHGKTKRSNRGMAKGTRLLRPEAITSNLLQSRYHAVRMTPPSPDDDLTAFQILLAFGKQHPQSDLERLGRPSNGLVSLLAAARRGVSKDAQHLYFDYFSMHMRGWELLKRLQRGLPDDLALAERASGQSFLSSDQHTLRAIPHYILQVLESSGKQGSLDSPVMRVVPRAIAIIERLASEQGSVEVAKVEKRMSGEEAESLPQTMPGQFPEKDSGDDYDDESDSASVSSADPDVNLMMEAVKYAPDEGKLSRDQMKEAVRMMKTTPQAELPPSTQQLVGMLQGKGADMSRKGLAGGMSTLMGMIQGLPDHAVEEIMATNDISKVMEIMRRNEQGSSNAGSSFDVSCLEPKKRNNKNKNKNRKMKQKAAKETQAASEAEL